MAHSIQHYKKVKNDHRRDEIEQQRPHSSPFEAASAVSVVEVRSKYGAFKNTTSRQKDRPKTAEHVGGIRPSRNLCSPDESTIKNRQSNSTLRFTTIREGVSDLLRRIRWNSNTSCSTRDSQASVATTQIIPLVRGKLKNETSQILENGEQGKRRRRSSRTRSVERKHRIFGDPKDLGTHGDRRKSSHNIQKTEIKYETASTEALVLTESEVLAIIETQRISEGEIITSARASDGEAVQSRSIQADLTQQNHLEKSVQANDGSQVQKLSKSPRVIHEAKVTSRRHHRHRARRLSNDPIKPRRTSLVKGKKMRRIKRKKCSDDEMEEFIPINNLRQSTDFSNPRLRTAAEILTEVIHNSEPQHMARRQTLIPVPPPQIGVGDRFTDPKVLPLLASHSVAPTSQTIGSRAVFQETMKTISNAFRSLISHNKEPADSNGNRMWLKQVLKENRAKNKAANRTYAVTFDWGIKRRPLREGNRSLITSFLRSLRLGKRDEGKDEPDDAQQHGWYDEGTSEARPEQFPSYFQLAPIAIPLPPPAPSDAEDLINKALELSQMPEYARAQYMTSDVDADSFDLIALSRKRRTSRSMQSHALNTILSASSKVSEKTEALLLASAGRSKGPFPVNPSKPAPKEKKSILTDDALLKIYTPKTEFTKQFATLLPSHRGTNGF